MTTGRINQVTTFLKNTKYSAARATFLGRSSFTDSTRLWPSIAQRLPCPPDLTWFRRISFCLLQQKEMAFKENYQQSAKKSYSLDHGGFPSVLVAKTVWPSASSPHSPSLCKHKIDVLDFSQSQSGFKISPFQISISLEEKHHWFGTRQASQPFSISKGILN